ncbi:MAG TPA: sugar ABC transporter permease [Ruminococcaceae bacterium]|jgi:ribose transport system permease protein|nr:sugar ABC transporter permease [Oscillospiraceae bacterium]HCB91838.1 sugar ABC transporter permease [Oscillospiraceae bacterium]
MTDAINSASTPKKKVDFKGVLTQLGSLLALFILCVILTIATPNFLTMTNFMNILRQTAINSFISAGMLLALITAGIDLSVGANCVLCGCVMGALANKLQVTNSFVLILAALATGLLVGLANGLLLTKLHLPHPFVSTMGMKLVLCGLALLVVNSQTVANFPEGVTALGSINLFKTKGYSGFPLAFLVVIIVFIIFHFFLTRSALGRKIFCVGGNPEAARLAGINSDNVLISVYTISGLMCAIAGIVLVGRTGVANPAAAMEPYDSDAIAACIIGGASFMGGKGTMWGTIIGALMISTIRNGLNLLQASNDIQNIVVGLVIIGAVCIDVYRGKMEERARRLATK